MNNYDREKAIEYWKHLPSGLGKHDSEAMLQLPDNALVHLWWKAFLSRIETYPEELSFILRHAQEFQNKSLLSVGAGLGFHEIVYTCFGAHPFVVDIVGTNLFLFERLCALIAIKQVATNIRHFPTLQKWVDVAYLWGSLHHMPTKDQTLTLQRIHEALNPYGIVVVMSYTWAFVEECCPGMTKETFDPVAFGAMADPAVGGLVSPWADWHDAERLAAVAGPIVILETGTYNRGRFQWYVFRFVQ